MREVKIRLISFSVFQFIFEHFDWGREVYHFMDLKKGNEGADTDLMFQFCSPYSYDRFETKLYPFSLS